MAGFIPSHMLLAGAAFAGLSASLSLPARAQEAYAPSVLSAQQNGYERELGCMAQAIVYEAGLEPVEGQQAVAQVILNRVRSRAYPDTVCGVVYQGSTRRTGCQFTFTCDGSLARRMSDRVMLAARMVAEDALQGRLPDRVGAATHYHASYVSPYWAPSLKRIGRIGAHIFYASGGLNHAPGAIITSRDSLPASVAVASGRDNRPFLPWGLSLPMPLGSANIN